MPPLVESENLTTELLASTHLDLGDSEPVVSDAACSLSQTAAVNRSNLPGVYKVREYPVPSLTAVTLHTTFKVSNDSHPTDLA